MAMLARVPRSRSLFMMSLATIFLEVLGCHGQPESLNTCEKMTFEFHFSVKSIPKSRFVTVAMHTCWHW